MAGLDNQRLGPYQLLEQIGTGGMASVYLAEDTRLERRVAIKVLPSAFLHNEEFQKRFEREAKAVASLEHAAIVPVYDYGEINDQPYIVMRYMPGGSLFERIQQSDLSLDYTAAIVGRIAGALDTAHARGIIHRDVKPANILFDEQGEPYLTDFGIVQMAEGNTFLTGTSILGTPAFIAPEIGQRETTDHLVDIYALGVTVFYALTGQLPYEADTPMGQLLAHHVRPIPNIREFRPSLPEYVQRVFNRALAKAPEDRYDNAQQFYEDLLGETHPNNAVQVRAPIRLPGDDVPNTEVMVIEQEEDEQDVPYHPAPITHPRVGSVRDIPRQQPPAPPPETTYSNGGRRNPVPTILGIIGFLLVAAGIGYGSFLLINDRLGPPEPELDAAVDAVIEPLFGGIEIGEEEGPYTLINTVEFLPPRGRIRTGDETAALLTLGESASVELHPGTLLQLSQFDTTATEIRQWTGATYHFVRGDKPYRVLIPAAVIFPDDDAEFWLAEFEGGWRIWSTRGSLLVDLGDLDEDESDDLTVSLSCIDVIDGEVSECTDDLSLVQLTDGRQVIAALATETPTPTASATPRRTSTPTLTPTVRVFAGGGSGSSGGGSSPNRTPTAQGIASSEIKDVWNCTHLGGNNFEYYKVEIFYNEDGQQIGSQVLDGPFYYDNWLPNCPLGEPTPTPTPKNTPKP